MPGPGRKPITDHHKHRAVLADEAFRKLEDGAFGLREIAENLEENDSPVAASEWEKGAIEIDAILARMRKLPR